MASDLNLIKGNVTSFKLSSKVNANIADDKFSVKTSDFNSSFNTNFKEGANQSVEILDFSNNSKEEKKIKFNSKSLKTLLEKESLKEYGFSNLDELKKEIDRLDKQIKELKENVDQEKASGKSNMMIWGSALTGSVGTSFAATNMSEYDNETQDKIDELTAKKNAYEYLYDRVNKETSFYVENVYSNTIKPDFSKNSIPNNDAINYIEKIKRNCNKQYQDINAFTVATNKDVSKINDYEQSISDSDKETIVAIISEIINSSDAISFKHGYNGLYGQNACIHREDGVTIVLDNAIINNFTTWKENITEEETQTFNYIYNTKGADAAYNYLSSISDVLDNRWLEKKTKEDEEFAKEHPVVASAMSVIITPIEGFNAAAGSIKSLLSDEDIKRYSVYSSGDVQRSAVASSIDSPVGSFLYQTGMSMVDSATLVAASALTGGVASGILSATLMGSRVYVSTLNSALDRGLSDSKAILLSSASAIIESAMEAYSLTNLMNLPEKLGTSVLNISNKIGNIHGQRLFFVLASGISQGITEAEEEVSTEMLNFVADEIISGNLSEFETSVNNHILAGSSYDEAFKYALNDKIKDIYLAGLGGLISGGVMGSSKVTIDEITRHSISKKISQDIIDEYENNTNFEVDEDVKKEIIATYDEVLRNGLYENIQQNNSSNLYTGLIEGDTSSQKFDSYVKIIKTDTKIKQLMYDLAPLNKTGLSSNIDAIELSDKMYSGLKDIKSYMNDILNITSISNEQKKHINDFFAKAEKEFIKVDLKDITGLSNWYSRYISNMSSDFVIKVNQVQGYTLNNGIDLKSATSVNEMLHALHHSIINNESNYKNMPDLYGKRIGEYGAVINAYGVSTDLAKKIFNNIGTDYKGGDIDLLSIDENTAYIMVRDAGHSLNIEIQNNGNDSYYVKYFIPECKDINLLNVVEGVNKVNEYNSTRGSFVVDKQNIGGKINEFIDSVPRDSQSYQRDLNIINSNDTSGIVRIFNSLMADYTNVYNKYNDYTIDDAYKSRLEARLGVLQNYIDRIKEIEPMVEQYALQSSNIDVSINDQQMQSIDNINYQEMQPSYNDNNPYSLRNALLRRINIPNSIENIIYRKLSSSLNINQIYDLLFGRVNPLTYSNFLYNEEIDFINRMDIEYRRIFFSVLNDSVNNYTKNTINPYPKPNNPKNVNISGVESQQVIRDSIFKKLNSKQISSILIGGLHPLTYKNILTESEIKYLSGLGKTGIQSLYETYLLDKIRVQKNETKIKLVQYYDIMFKEGFFGSLSKYKVYEHIYKMEYVTDSKKWDSIIDNSNFVAGFYSPSEDKIYISPTYHNGFETQFHEINHTIGDMKRSAVIDLGSLGKISYWYFGLNEGVTEYFAQQSAKRFGVETNPAYRFSYDIVSEIDSAFNQIGIGNIVKQSYYQKNRTIIQDAFDNIMGKGMFDKLDNYVSIISDDFRIFSKIGISPNSVQARQYIEKSKMEANRIMAEFNRRIQQIKITKYN